MSIRKEIGTVAEFDREVRFQWVISDFFSYTEQNSRYYSPAFPVLDCTWQIEIWPKFTSNDSSDEYVSLYLSKINNKTPRDVHLTFFLKSSANNIINNLEKTCTFTDQRLGWAQFISRNTLQIKKNEYVPSDTLTIVCSLLIKPNKQDFIARPDKLTEDFREMFKRKKDSDVTFNIKDHKISAHKSILSARCPVFAAMFEKEMEEKKTGVVNITDCDFEVFNDFLVYLYSGEVQFKKCDAFHLYKIADKYRVPELMTICVDFMIRNLSIENICETFVFGNQFREDNLLARAQRFFNRNLQKIIFSDQWECFLKEDFNLANELLKGMAQKVKEMED